MKNVVAILFAACVIAPTGVRATETLVTKQAAPPVTESPIKNQPATVAGIVEKEGQFLFSDGSCFYLFRKDGVFKSGPIGLSGRTINGTWKPAGGVWSDNPYAFEIQGIWAGINRVSASNDRRKMVVTVYSEKTFISEKHFTFAFDEDVSNKVYDCYFEIEELVKLPQPSVAPGTK